MVPIKRRFYRVNWVHAETGSIHRSGMLEVSSAGDVIVEHIAVLAQFRGVFHGSSPVEKIVSVELMHEE